MREFLKFLWQQLKPHKRTIIACSALAILAAGLDTAAPALMGRSFDLAQKKSGVAWYGGMLLGWFLARLVAERMRAWITQRGQHLAAVTREKVTEDSIIELLQKPLAFHHGKMGPAISEKLGQLRWDFHNVIDGAVFGLVPSLLATAAIIGYLVAQNWLLGLTLGLGLVAYIWYSFQTAPKSVDIVQRWQAASQQVSTTGLDALHNVLIVKSTGNETVVRQTLAGKRHDFVRADDDWCLFDLSIANRQNLIIAVTSLAVLAIALQSFTSGTFTFGQLTALTAYAFQVFGYVRSCQWQFRQVLKAVAGYKVMREVLDEPAEDFTSGQPAKLGGAVEFRRVRFRYREERPALEDVSFRVEPGERVAVVGESGEGKTTLVNLIGRYFIPQAGEILFDGRPGVGIRLDSLRSQIALVPQDLSLFHESLAFNIRYGRLDATDEEVREAARLAHLEEFIEGLPEKYETVVGERGLKLSGGERQRVAIARAFLRHPKILILDEPTSNLDSRTENFIQESLEGLMRGRTTFIIAHRLRTIAGTDKVLVLHDGRIAEAGSPRELAARPDGAYSILLKAQGGFISPDEPHLGTEAAA